jgi:hypothetical protein
LVIGNYIFFYYNVLSFCRCNCGTEDRDWYTAEDNEIRSDIGVISDESQLPIRRIYTFSPQSETKFVTTKLGPLECIQGD